MTIKAEILADHATPSGIRITTFELEYPRFIHAQMKTHRMFSSNSQSSRAVPVQRMVNLLKEDTAMPIFWGKNKSGMSAGGVEINSYVMGMYREEAWNMVRDYSITYALGFQESGYHKEIVNRLLEPYMHIKTVLTATEWDNFYWLRTDKDAQPDIQALAKRMKELQRASYPRTLREGEWHTPYFANGFWTKESGVPLQQALKISVSCCAQVSYRRLDDSEKKADKVFDMLHLTSNNEGKPHYSCSEHQATPIPEKYFDGGGWELIEGISHRTWDNNLWSGNFKGWIQFRKLLEEHSSPWDKQTNGGKNGSV